MCQYPILKETINTDVKQHEKAVGNNFNTLRIAVCTISYFLSHSLVPPKARTRYSISPTKLHCNSL